MSKFDSVHTSQYIQNLRSFLRMNKIGFHKAAGLADATVERNRGRLPSYPKAAVEALENKANLKAALCESNDLSLAKRFRLARDAKDLTDIAIARFFNVTRELVRRWGEGYNRPSDLDKLANFLDVPVAWLKHGGADHLPANSHLGVRVGKESFAIRDELKTKTEELLSELPPARSESQTQALIEFSVMNRLPLAKLARQAGGRWQLVQNQLVFAPWVPLAPRGLVRRYWSDEVELIIEEELLIKPSTSAAWRAIKTRSEAKNLDYPCLISLQKRQEKRRKWVERFGIEFNLNNAI